MFHSHAVTCMDYSRDDRFLLSLGELIVSVTCSVRQYAYYQASFFAHTHTHAYSLIHFFTQTHSPTGTFQENALAIWSSVDYSLLTATNLSLAAHELRWDPSTAYEFTTVGAGGSVIFWLLEEEPGGRGCKLKVGGVSQEYTCIWAESQEYTCI